MVGQGGRFGARAARSGRSGRSLGDKCDEEIKTAVPAHLKETLTGLAVLEDVPLAEYVRCLLVEHAYGRRAAIRMHAQVPRGEGPE